MEREKLGKERECDGVRQREKERYIEKNIFSPLKVFFYVPLRNFLCLEREKKSIDRDRERKRKREKTPDKRKLFFPL